MALSLLDCSLRDGAHTNGGKFGKENIRLMVSGPFASGIDIIEIGWLTQGDFDHDTSKWADLVEAAKILPGHSPERFALMIRVDWLDRSSLPKGPEDIQVLRLAFRRKDLKKALAYCGQLSTSGFRVFLNPIDTPAYSRSDLATLSAEASKLGAAGITVVDTYGLLSSSALAQLISTIERELRPGACIGLHLHENQSSGMLLVESALNRFPHRDFLIDGTLRGIGRAPGNIPLEVLAHYANQNQASRYSLDPLIKCLEDCIEPHFPETPWAYSPVYFLSSVYELDRTYAEFLTHRFKVSLTALNEILKKLTQSGQRDFSEKHAVEALKGLGLLA